jgi:proteasome beta subunit
MSVPSPIDPRRGFVDPIARFTEPTLTPRMSDIHRMSETAHQADHRSPGDVTLTHATTIVAMRYTDGVLMAGDRRATAGNVIAHRTMDKVFPADKYSGVSISGVAGLAAEMVKMFQLELEHYEKVEGLPLSLDGKANRLGNMIRQNLPSAMSSGMVVIPIFAGYDLRRKEGRIYNYDITGGRYEEMEFHATGSGGIYARGVIKQQWRRGMTRDDAVELAIGALFDAADDDSATGGPDLIRGIFPSVATITVDGYSRVTDEEVARRSDTFVKQRQTRLAGDLSLSGQGASAPAVVAPSTGKGAKS